MEAMKMNLFLDALLTDKDCRAGVNEDYLTAFFAAALYLSPVLRERYYDIVLKRYAARQGWGACTIDEVGTWLEAPEGNPDMGLKLSNGKRIACEHKVYAPETTSAQSITGPDQLKRYLSSREFDGLVYVRHDERSPSQEVLADPKYIRPEGRTHFRWSDFYPLFEDATDPFNVWMREGFIDRGLHQQNSAINDREPDEARQAIAELWNQAKSFACSRGWVGCVHGWQLYLTVKERVAEQVLYQRQEKRSTFLVRATPSPGHGDECFERMKVASTAYGAQPHSISVRRGGSPVQVFDVEVATSQVLGPADIDTAAAEQGLLKFVSHFLNVLDPPPDSAVDRRQKLYENQPPKIS